MKTESLMIERVFFELNVMSKRYVTVRELAERTEVSERTIKRDIAFMRDRLGINVRCVGHGFGYTVSDISVPKPVGM